MQIKRSLYKAALALLASRTPPLRGEGLLPTDQQRLYAILNRHRCQGGCFRLFEGENTLASYAFGDLQPGLPARQDSLFRIASISKMLTAACCLRLAEQGRLDMDQDVNDYAPFALRHPNAPDRPITMRMLLSHTSGIQDSPAYHQGILDGTAASDILRDSGFGEALPGESWRYSNFGAGLVGSLLEALLGLSFEEIMQAELFRPLNVEASFYPQLLAGDLADAYRLPRFSQRVNFNAQERQARPRPAPQPQPEQHYTLAQGNACTSATGLQSLLLALMRPGYLNRQSLDMMRSPVAGFGRRSAHMRQGLGLFLINDARLSPHTIYGHQGNAYGAVYAAFFELKSQRGFVLLTTAASEARQAFLADLAGDMIAFCLGNSDG